MKHNSVVMTPNYLRRLLWFIGIIMALNIATVTLMGVLLGGGKQFFINLFIYSFFLKAEKHQ